MIKHSEMSNRAEARRKLIHLKLKYKRRVIVCILGIGFTYLSFSVNNVHAAPKPFNDLPDTVPISEQGFMFSPEVWSRNWKLAGNLCKIFEKHQKFSFGTS